MSAELATMNDTVRYSELVSQSDIIPQAYRGKPANVLIAVDYGSAMGLRPAESLYRINVIQGKPAMGGELVAAQVRKAGHKLRIKKDEEHMSVTAQIIRADDPDFTFEVTRDAAWAQSMGLSGKDNYKKQPLTMLMWRAVTAVAREACPEALFGAGYTADELHDFDTPQTSTMPVSSQAASHTAQSKPKTAAKRLQVEISTIFKECGVDSKELAGAALSLLANRTVATTAELTADEAKTILADKNTRQRVTELVEATKAQTEANAEPSMEQPDIIDAEIVED